MTASAISLIICTYKRDKILWETLSCLISQIEPEDEIIVIDQNSPRLIIPVHLAHAGIRHIHTETPSLTKARNLGIGISGCSMTLFLDDDIIPDSDLLNTYRETAAAHPQCVIAGGVLQDDRPRINGVGMVNLKTGEIITNYADCKSPGYVRFFSDHCFNEGLFYGSHGKLLFFWLFLKRMKNFIEFHSRGNQERPHSIVSVIAGTSNLIQGLTFGLFYRFWDFFNRIQR